jgi:hypothetical protein
MKEVLERVKIGLQSLFGSLIGTLLKRGTASIKAVNVFKNAVEDPAVNFIVALTPTKADDILLKKAKQVLPDVLTTMTVSLGILSMADAGDDPKKISAWVAKYLRENATDTGRAIFYRELNGLVYEALMNDNRVTSGEYVAIGQFLFKRWL